MSDHTECKVLILWKNKSWEERYMKFIMPEGYTETELTERAVQATMSNLAAVGKLDNVHTMGVTTDEETIVRVELEGDSGERLAGIESKARVVIV